MRVSSAKLKPALLITAAFVLFILLSPILFLKCTVPLVNGNKIAAIAKKQFGQQWGDIDVYVGQSKAFSLWGGSFLEGRPLLIYPLSDSQKFLCVFDDDLAVLVFIVDLRTSATNNPTSSKWPSDDDLRNHLARRATNVVTETKGQIRLPDFTELEEASGNLSKMTSSQFKAASFPKLDLGVYRFYWPREAILERLKTNRQSYW